MEESSAIKYCISNNSYAILTPSSLRSSMAEQRTLNAMVGGSTPLVGTHFILISPMLALVEAIYRVPFRVLPVV